MNYIILDMEWDNAYCPKFKGFINQILQIGAVKIDADMRITDTFDVTVKSSFTKKVSRRCSELTGITTEEMLAGVPLEVAIGRYNEWAGNDTVTLTWSDSDLYTVLQNEKLLPDGVRMHIEKYMDLQKYIQNEMRLCGYEVNGQISLANAAEILGVTAEGLELHNAKDDSILSAALLKKYFCPERMKQYIKDTENPEFYARLRFKPYYIKDISNRLIDGEQLKFLCDSCGGEAKRKSRWRFNNRWFKAEFCCPECKRRFIGRVCFRKTFDDLIVKKAITEIKRKQDTAVDTSDTAQKDVNNEMQSLSTTV